MNQPLPIPGQSSLNKLLPVYVQPNKNACYTVEINLDLRTRLFLIISFILHLSILFFFNYLFYKILEIFHTNPCGLDV